MVVKGLKWDRTAHVLEPKFIHVPWDSSESTSNGDDDDDDDDFDRQRFLHHTLP